MRLSFPSKKNAAKWALGILGTIILGALGSGVWQWLLGPAIHAITRWTLDVASLGMRSYKDGVYQAVAIDSQSRMGAETLFIVTMTYAMLALTVAAGLYVYWVFLKRRGRALLHRIGRLCSDRPAEAEMTPPQSPESLREEVQGILRSMGRAGWLVYPWLVAMVLGIGAHFVTVARFGYISQATSHYH